MHIIRVGGNFNWISEVAIQISASIGGKIHEDLAGKKKVLTHPHLVMIYESLVYKTWKLFCGVNGGF